MAAGKHPFPYRTRQLSPPAPMVLGGEPPGRVGRRRDITENARFGGRSRALGGVFWLVDKGAMWTTAGRRSARQRGGMPRRPARAAGAAVKRRLAVGGGGDPPASTPRKRKGAVAHPGAGARSTCGSRR